MDERTKDRLRDEMRSLHTRARVAQASGASKPAVDALERSIRALAQIPGTKLRRHIAAIDAELGRLALGLDASKTSGGTRGLRIYCRIHPEEAVGYRQIGFRNPHYLCAACFRQAREEDAEAARAIYTALMTDLGHARAAPTIPVGRSIDDT